MKNKILLILFLSTLIFAQAQVVEKVYYFEKPEITQHGEYHSLKFQNTLNTALKGEPALPYCSVMLLLPEGEAAKSVEIIFSEEKKLDGKFMLMPYQPSQPVSKHEKHEFFKNEKVYQSADIFPKSSSGKLSTQFMNGYSFAQTAFTPVKYKPLSGEIVYYSKATVRIKTTKTEKAQEALKLRSSLLSVKQKIEQISQNPEMISRYDFKTSYNSPYQLLIITSDNFKNSFNTLVGTYLVRGINSQIVTTQEINQTSTGSDLQEKIRNFITAQYQNNAVEFVLLGGDVEIIPYRGFYCTVQSSSVYVDEAIPSDLYYSSLDGTWNTNGNSWWGEIGEDDLLPEVSVGRLPFSTQGELENMLHKILSYQNTPITTELNRPSLIGEHLYDNPLTWGAQYLDLLIGFHTDNGYSTAGIPENHPYVRLSDRDDGTWSVSTLLNLLNQGTSFIHHVGHSNTNYTMRLYDSDITNNNFSQLNGIAHNYTLLYTHGCICGSYDASDCIAEEMLKIENFLAAFVGNSRFGWFNEGQTEGPSAHIHREFVSALYGDKIPYIGTCHAISKARTAPWVNAPGQHEEGAIRWCFYDCNVLGDPAMSIWTDSPITPTAVYETPLSIGNTAIQVNLSYLGQALKNYNCVLIKNNEFYGSASTNHDGQAEIVFTKPFTSTGNLQLIVSGYNCKPVTYNIELVSPQSEYIVLTDFTINDQNQSAENGETVSFNLKLKNVGLTNSQNLSLNLQTDDEFVTLTSNSLNINSITAQSEFIVEGAFEVKISDIVADQHLINLNLNISQNSGQTWSYNFNFVANAPEFLFSEIIIDDAEGDSDGIIDQQENFTLNIPLTNVGHCPTNEISATLTCYNENFEITDNQFTANSLGIAENVNLQFELNSGMQIEAGLPVIFVVTLQSGQYSVIKYYVEYAGLISENFESGNFENLDWQTSGNAGWLISQTAATGNYSASSGAIDDTQNSILEITCNGLPAGNISFKRKVSSENNYDYLRFYIDNNLISEWSGDQDWNTETFAVVGGNHTFKWIYEKDYSVASGDDRAYIDDIIFPPGFLPLQNSLISNLLLVEAELEPSQTTSKTITLSNIGENAFDFDIAIEQMTEGNWLTVSPTSDNLEADENKEISLNFSAANLLETDVIHQCILQVTNNLGETVNIEVRLKIVSSSTAAENSANYQITAAPNPFKNKTRLSYYVPEKQNVNLTVYNYNGQVIEPLFSSVQNKGLQTIDLNLEKLGVGVFFLKIESKNINKTLKLISY